MNQKTEVKEIKKLDNGDFAIRWKGARSWNIVKKDDQIIVEFIVGGILNKFIINQ